MLLLAGGAWWLSRPSKSQETTRTSVFPGELQPPRQTSSYKPRPAGQITFNRDIAPIVWNRCTPCHRSGQVAPFPLIHFQDFHKRTRQIAEVTESRYMPPWLPESGFGEFEGERRLTVEELGLIQQWIAEGAPEGSAADLPGLPAWTEDWFLGKPDLVVSMEKPFSLGPEGRDVYRNFVIPVPGEPRRFVRALEFRPGNSRIVHHAFVYVDQSRRSRQLAEAELQPGFSGMRVPESARMPEGQFLSYQPGKRPMASPEGLGWVLEPGSDLVLQVHLNPSGKPEALTCSVGLYFTDKPPLHAPFKLALTSLTIDVPPGQADYRLTDSFVLPVDAYAVGILPHAHYLAREMRADAALPDGSTLPLLWIRDWDFRWQGDYRYAQPLFLPKGTTVSMRYRYDNSAANVRNPNRPPLRVRYGPQSTDEMGEFWLQLTLKNPADRPVLARAYEAKVQASLFDRTEFELKQNPQDGWALLTRAKILFQRGKNQESLAYFEKAIQATPESVGARYDFGVFLLELSKFSEAEAQFAAMKKLDASDSRAHGGLGSALMNQGQLDAATRCFEEALRLNPRDRVAAESLKWIRQQPR